MRDNLIGHDREQFFLSVIERLAEAEVKVIDDKYCSVANLSDNLSTHLTHEQDATYLLFERINRLLGEIDEAAVVINDRPSEPENKILSICIGHVAQRHSLCSI